MALKEFRTATKTWVATLFVGLLVISFIMWGGYSDIFTGGGGRGVAKVGSSWVSTGDFQRRLRAEINRQERETGQPLTTEEIQALGIQDGVLSQLIDETAVDRLANQMGLRVHDDTLKRIIRDTAAFQGLDGKFDAATYQRTLQSIGLSPEGYENELRKSVARAQLLGSVMRGATMPRGLIQQLLYHRGEAREISYVLLDPALVGDIPNPDEATLKAYVDAHAERFTRPELRSFTAVAFRPADFKDKAEVSEEDIQASYEFDKESFTVAERRQVRQIPYADESFARAAYQQITSGQKTFDQLEAEVNMPEAERAFKDLAQADFLDEKVAAAVFAAPGPGLLEPVDGALAWTLVEVGAVTPGYLRPLDEVRGEIRDKLALAKSEEVIQRVVDQFEDGRASGETLEELTQRLGLKLVKYEKVDAEGKNGDGVETVPPEDAELVANAFASEQGAENDLAFSSDGGQFVVRVDEVLDPELRPMASIEAGARAAWLAEERAKRLKEMAEELARKHETDGLGALAAELGRAPATLPAPLRRLQESEILSSTLVGGLFDAEIGKLVVGEAAVEGSYVVAAVMKIDHPTSAELASGVQSLSAPLDEALESDLVTQFVQGLRDDMGVRIDQALVETASANAR